ncbi:DUF4439 domain-containing protein [Cellulomonas sp. NPDC089187]|uniref:DUF4439 domain-containing protein n=1 Tax=Cellulomonas sp. NPDC089187 TaxID=3154970 RepID=UPI00342D2819
MSTTSAPRPRHRLAALVAVAALALSGCGLRLESPAPTEPTPDAAESVRRNAVQDALALADSAAGLADGAEPALGTVLTLIEDAAAVQVDQLGGVYDSGLETPTASPSPSSTPAATSTAELLALLGSTASSARSAAVQESDPQMARLLAAIAAARSQQAVQLASTLGAEVPGLAAPDEVAAEAAVTDTGSLTSTPGAADGSGSGDGSATDAPATLPAATLTALVVAEDQAGYGYEVAAARLSEDARTTALADARTHRARAESWAQVAGIAGTGQDPRQVAYDLGSTPTEADAVRTFCAGLERQLTDVYADALLETGADSGDRVELVDRLREAALDLLTWGGTATALPGMDSVVS